MHPNEFSIGDTIQAVIFFAATFALICGSLWVQMKYHAPFYQDCWWGFSQSSFEEEESSDGKNDSNAVLGCSACTSKVTAKRHSKKEA